MLHNNVAEHHHHHHHKQQQQQQRSHAGLTRFEKRRYVCRVLRSLIESLSCAHGRGRLCDRYISSVGREGEGGVSFVVAVIVYRQMRIPTPFIEADPGHAIWTPFIGRETSSSILAEQGKSWRPIGGAPELGREEEEEEEDRGGG